MQNIPYDEGADHPFGPTEEEGIISLALDLPEPFLSVAGFLKPAMMKRLETRYVLAHVLNTYSEFGTVPTRPLLRDIITKDLTVDDPYDDILRVVDRPSNTRELPIIRQSLFKWVRGKAYGLIFSEEAQEAYARGDYSYLDGLVENAHKLTDVQHNAFWFYDQFEELFVEDARNHFTTGHRRLDKELNGGPSSGEVVCILAATNVGKSIELCNIAIASSQPRRSCIDPSVELPGENTLFISLEMSKKKVGHRELGILTGHPIKERQTFREQMRQIILEKKQKAGELGIFELPPDECSVDHIGAIIEQVRRSKGWTPKVLVVDYMELLTSRHAHYNKEEYLRQKHVATELRALAKKYDCVVFTATQGNRSSSNSEETVDLQNVAESFGKMMPLDYVVTLNQTPAMHAEKPARISFFIAKNRDGSKNVHIDCHINYNNMRIQEID